jgi:predicted choloylglycine hydrolase
MVRSFGQAGKCRTALLAVAGVVVATAPAVWAQEVITPTGRGWLETVTENGRSLTVLHASGSHYDMGYQHGYLLAEQVVQNVQAGLIFIQDPKLVQHPASELPAAVAELTAHTPQKYIDEINGIIAGVAAAGGPQLSFQDVMTTQVTADLMQVTQCTEFAAKGGATTNGHTIHGRNLDWPTVPDFAHDRAILMINKPLGEQATCIPSWAGYMGAVTGMNASGVSVGTNTCITSDSTWDGVPLTFLLRGALEGSSTLDEFTGYLNANPRTVGTNLVVSSGREAGGRVAAVEVTPTRNEIYTDNDPRETMYWDGSTGTMHATQDNPAWLRVSGGIQDAVVRTNHFTNWQGDLPLQALQAGATVTRYLDPNAIIALGFDPDDLKDVNWVMANIYPNIIIPLGLRQFPYNVLLPEIMEPNWTFNRYNVMQGLITGNYGNIDAAMGIAFMTQSSGIPDELSMHSVIMDSTSLEFWVANARTENGVVIDATSEPFVHYNFGAAIPEPTSMAVLATGAALIFSRRWLRRRR